MDPGQRTRWRENFDEAWKEIDLLPRVMRSRWGGQYPETFMCSVCNREIPEGNIAFEAYMWATTVDIEGWLGCPECVLSDLNRVRESIVLDLKIEADAADAHYQTALDPNTRLLLTRPVIREDLANDPDMHAAQAWYDEMATQKAESLMDTPEEGDDHDR